MNYKGPGGNYIKNVTRCIYSCPWNIVARVNSISRGDPNHLIFVNNSLFVACNLVGEIILTDKNLSANSNLEDSVEKFCGMFKEWINARVVEGILMASLGGAQEEGFFAQLRKFFMILMGMARQKDIFSWNIKDLCTEMNECLIDRPLAMHFASFFIDLLKHWNPTNKSFSNVQ